MLYGIKVVLMRTDQLKQRQLYECLDVSKFVTICPLCYNTALTDMFDENYLGFAIKTALTRVGAAQRR